MLNHPFSVAAHFISSTVLTFACSVKDLQKMIPPCLTLDTFQDKYAFIAIALVRTKHLRPRGLPIWTGQDFILSGYRIFVRYRDQRGKNLRGLYIIKSETNKKRMEIFGNFFTHYNYTTTDINYQKEGEEVKIFSNKSDYNFTYNESDNPIPLPAGSPFEDWKTARRYAGPLPFTFTYNADSQLVTIIEGVRTNWKPKPVAVTNYHFNFLNNLPVSEVKLANTFIIKDVPYYWKKGKTEIWKP